MDILNSLRLSGNDFIDQQNIENALMPLENPGAVAAPLALDIGTLAVTDQADPGLKLRAKSSLSATARLFNEENDQDPDGLLATAGNPEGIIPFNVERPVFSYALNFEASGTIGDSTGNVSTGIEAGAGLRMLVYRVHEKTTTVAEAIIRDFTTMPFIMTKNDMETMANGEAVVIETHARLGASLGFELSGAFSAGLSGISSLIKSDQVLVANVETGVNIGVNYSLSDTYQLIFVKDDSDGFDYRVSVKKSKSTSVGISAGTEVSVGFQNPKALTDYINRHLDSLVAQATNITTDKLSRVIAETEKVLNGSLRENDMSPEDQSLISALNDYFNIGDTGDKLRTLSEKIATLKQALQEQIMAQAQKKIGMAIRFEYSRVSSHSTLLQARIRKPVLDRTHASLVRFNPQPLIEQAIQDTSNIKLTDFLKQTMTKTRTKWGISVGFGKFKIGGSDSTSREFITSENIRGHKKVSFDGIRAYEEQGTLGGFSDQWSVGFNPVMERFSENTDPLPREFSYGFALSLEHFCKKFKGRSEDQLVTRQILSNAVCWSILPQQDFDQTFDQIWEALKSGRKKGEVTFTTSMNFGKEAFDTIEQKWRQLLTGDSLHMKFMAEALAQAMPYREYPVRKDRMKCMEAYAPLWLAYLRSAFQSPQSNPNSSGYATLAQNHFRATDNALARFEGLASTDSFGNMIRQNNLTGTQWKTYASGIRQVLDTLAANADTDYNTWIKNGFNQLKSVWSQSYHIKAFGTYLVRLSQFDPALLSKIDSTLEIQYQSPNGTGRKLVIRSTKPETMPKE